MNRSLRKLLAPVAIATLLFTGGCSTEGGSVTESNPEIDAKVDKVLAEMAEKVLSKGPHGEEAAQASVSDLTDEEVAQVKDMGLSAALVMHYGGNDWANAQIKGLKDEFGRLGVEILAITDANFKPDKQVSDIETVMAMNPDIIVSIPTDPVATSAAYKKVADAGIKLVFMDNVPEGLEPGKDYVSMVSADNEGNGVAAAHLMAKGLGGKGKIGLIFHEADFFVTQQRYEGFKSTITEQYPDIEIVAEQGIAGPDFAGDAQAAANAMLTRHADLSGIWAVWDVPAEGVMAAARESGRLDLKIATQDLGTNVALAMAKNDLVIGLGAQRPYDQGITEARLAVGSLIGKEAPPYVALGAVAVDHDNVVDSWKLVFGEEAPTNLVEAAGK
ncbi:substrate-binding domain-containing protein [Gleimia europaea]|uniref:Periplasmic binding protein domain-containing protein n=1 Tax=Gleimia europaea ACS-120-V-Col10b TaxID=883069 RepID=A0A9W5REK0_9ACTO|nr:substrate-binding domain-containing protein [Gleimia europaea]EPD30940.1 hypothetical protein HMPREF9238_00695 [Gleimia europaea ACS-120-V-Col10b]